MATEYQELIGDLKGELDERLAEDREERREQLVTYVMNQTDAYEREELEETPLVELKNLAAYLGLEEPPIGGSANAMPTVNASAWPAPNVNDRAAEHGDG
jgi:hypothetical protein